MLTDKKKPFCFETNVGVAHTLMIMLLIITLSIPHNSLINERNKKNHLNDIIIDERGPLF